MVECTKNVPFCIETVSIQRGVVSFVQKKQKLNVIEMVSVLYSFLLLCLIVSGVAVAANMEVNSYNAGCLHRSASPTHVEETGVAVANRLPQVARPPSC